MKSTMFEKLVIVGIALQMLLYAFIGFAIVYGIGKYLFGWW